ncbi:MAG: glycosyltransferase family 2 protein [Desulfovibrionaceae bacterium]
MPEISIVVPVYNSADCLRELVRRIDASVRPGYELILVNDGSRDASWRTISTLTVANGVILGVDLRRNSGQDNALMAGLRLATGDFVVIMDDDLQHAPEDIEALHQACVAGNHDVCFANFESRQHKGWKNWGSWLNGKMAEVLVDKPRHIYLSPFKIMRGDVVRDLCRYQGPYPYVDGQLMATTSHLGQIDLPHHQRFSGASTYTLWRSIKVWSKHLTGFSVFPLRAASLLGGCFAVFGFLLGLFFMLRHLFVGVDVEGWTSLMCITLFTGGVILLCLGVMGEYIGRSYLLLNAKPQYSIRETVRLGVVAPHDAPVPDSRD